MQTLVGEGNRLRHNEEFLFFFENPREERITAGFKKHVKTFRKIYNINKL